jgi:hypothetical protein
MRSLPNKDVSEGEIRTRDDDGHPVKAGGLTGEEDDRMMHEGRS